VPWGDGPGERRRLLLPGGLGVEKKTPSHRATYIWHEARPLERLYPCLPSAWHGYCYYRKVRTSGYGPEGRARRCRPIWLLLPETRNRTESRSTLARGCSSPEGRIRLRCTWRTIVTTDLTCLTRVLLEPRYQVLLRRAEYSANTCSHDDNGTVFIADRVTLYDIYARQRCALFILMRKGALYV
jgi:hypothetical protein